MARKFNSKKAHQGESISGEGSYETMGLNDRTVYVRQLLPGDELRSQIEGELEDVNQSLFAVVSASGEPLAVVGDRATAFAGAKRNNLRPVSVH